MVYQICFTGQIPFIRFSVRPLLNDFVLKGQPLTDCPLNFSHISNLIRKGLCFRFHDPRNDAEQLL